MADKVLLLPLDRCPAARLLHVHPAHGKVKLNICLRIKDFTVTADLSRNVKSLAVIISCLQDGISSSAINIYIYHLLYVTYCIDTCMRLFSSAYNKTGFFSWEYLSEKISFRLQQRGAVSWREHFVQKKCSDKESFPCSCLSDRPLFKRLFLNIGAYKAKSGKRPWTGHQSIPGQTLIIHFHVCRVSNQPSYAWFWTVGGSQKILGKPTKNIQTPQSPQINNKHEKEVKQKHFLNDNCQIYDAQSNKW